LISKPNLCLTATGETATGNVDVIVAACLSPPAENQQWHKEASGQWQEQQMGKCMDVQAQNHTAGSNGNLEVFSCHPARQPANQAFSLTSGGQLVSGAGDGVVQVL
jgi:hypothetical protein